MAKRFVLGRHSKWSLKAMHSPRGTKTFKMLSPNKQRAWSSWDSKHSRRGLMKAAGMHGRGGSHK